MNKTHLAKIAMLAALSGCTVQPLADGGYRLSTPSLEDMLNPTAASSTPAEASPSSSTDATDSQTTQASLNYAGQIDGGTANAELTPVGPGQYHLTLGAKGTGSAGQLTGMGGVSGVLTESAGGNTYTMTQADDGNACYLTVKLNGNALQIDEDFSPGHPGCMAEHGAALSFDGTLSRVTSTNS